MPPGERDTGPALEAGIGLGVEAPVERIGVLGSAALAHGEGRHGGGGAVVGQVVDDGEARPAVRAVDEGIAVAAVVGVEELVHAVGAGGQLGRHQSRLGHGLVVGEANLKTVEGLQGHFLDVDLLHLRSRRRVVGQLHDELVHQLALTLGVDVHPIGRVQHPAVDEVLLRRPIDKGTEAHPLHNALHMNVNRVDHELLLTKIRFPLVYPTSSTERPLVDAL